MAPTANFNVDDREHLEKCDFPYEITNVDEKINRELLKDFSGE